MANPIDGKVHPQEWSAPPLGTAPTVVIDSPLEFTNSGQTTAPSTAALMMGGGTATTPLTTATADKNFLGYWFSSTATSGDSRGMYLRLYFSGTGVSGEALRAYGTVNNVTAATGGTVNGAHISLLVTGASGAVSGAGNALRATLELAASTNVGGTVSVIQVDSSFGASATVPATAAFFHLDNVGTAPTTNGIPNLFNILNPDTTTFFTAAGTGANSAALAGGGIAAKALKCTVAGVDYWLPLFSSNSN